MKRLAAWLFPKPAPVALRPIRATNTPLFDQAVWDAGIEEPPVAMGLDEWAAFEDALDLLALPILTGTLRGGAR